MTERHTENQRGSDQNDTNQPPLEAEPTHKLTPKQELFCLEYLKDRNGTKAYIRAGYSAEGARQNASTLTSNHYIKSRVNELIAEQINTIKLDVHFILKELLKHATIDLSDAYDENGNLKAVNEMPEPLRKAISSIETEELFEGRGEDREHIGTAKKIRLTDKLKALELLGKHLKMFTEVHEIPGLENLAAQIKAARKRADNARSRTGAKTTA